MPELAERSEELSVFFAEMISETGEDVLVQRLVDALPEDLELHAFGVAGEIDAKEVALERIQKARKSKRGSGMT